MNSQRNEHEKPTRKQRLKHISNREWLRPQPEKEKINKHDSRIEIEKIKNTTHIARAASAVPHQPDSTNPTHPPVLTSTPPLCLFLLYYLITLCIHLSTARGFTPSGTLPGASVRSAATNTTWHCPHFVTSSLPPCTPCQPRPRQQAWGWRARSAIH